ncbi:MAG: hypothetical protein RL138_174 [Bacteroidota bacterium]
MGAALQLHAQEAVVEAPRTITATPSIKMNQMASEDSVIRILSANDPVGIDVESLENYQGPRRMSDRNYKYTTVSQELRLSNFQEAISKVSAFMAAENFDVTSQNQNNSSFTANLVLTKEQLAKWNSFILTFGYLSMNNINVIDNTANVEAAIDNLNNAQRQLKNAKERLAQTKVGDENYNTYFSDRNNWESNVQTYRRNLRNILATNNLATVSLTIIDEMYTPQNTRVSFVNMPGAEYSYLKIDEPLDTVSNSAYQGVLLKYVFTRGKSFANLGAYKTTAPASPDRKHFSEMFIFGFGQDFYTRHFGHGNNRYLNMYTTYTVGGLLASNESRKLFSPYIAPGVGVELFKNKYVLIDTKASYFVPFKDIRHMRGLSLSASFNFVF